LLSANDGKIDNEIVAVKQRVQLVERTRKRFVGRRSECLHGVGGTACPRLDERQQAHLIAVVCSPGAGRLCALDGQLLKTRQSNLVSVDLISQYKTSVKEKTNSNRG